MKKLLCTLLLIFCLIGVYASEAFELADVYESGITDSVFYSYIHKDTGLKVVYENNDAGNNYAELMFRTPMQDEGDLNHVFEHSLLSGSDKYPSSYLFFDFSHRSYLSSVNADTQMSSTAYHAASPSSEQIEIYIDALFSLVDDPDLIHEENIYRREAIRYDLQSVDGPITPAGTVFNEDVGYITDEVRGAVEGVFRALYPGMYASNIIGRLPMHLEDNTYERIKEIFSDYYNWDNALLYAYGDINIDRVLDDIDREYLSVSDKPSTDLSEFYSEEPEPGYRELDYPIPASSDKVITDSSSYIIYAFELGDLEFDELLKLDPIIQILTKDGGILDEELEKRSVDGVDVVELDLSTLRPVLEFLLFYTSPEERNGFREAVDAALSRAASGEISGDEIADMAGIIKNSILSSTEDGSLSVSNADIYRNLFALTGGIDAIEIYENVLADLEEDGEDIAYRCIDVDQFNSLAGSMPLVSQADVLHAQVRAILDIAVRQLHRTTVSGIRFGPFGIFPVFRRPAAVINILRNITDSAHRNAHQVGIEDIAADTSLQEEAEGKVLVREVLVHTEREIRIRISDNLFVGLRNAGNAIEVLVLHFSDHGLAECLGFIRIERIGSYLSDIIIETVLDISPDRTDRHTVSLDEGGIGATPALCELVAGKAVDLIPVDGYIDVEIPAEAPYRYRIELSCNLNTLIGYVTEVGRHVGESSTLRNLDVLQQVERLLIIEVYGKVDLVLQEAHVDTHVVLVRGFPPQIRVGRSTPGQTGIAALQGTVDRIVRNRQIISRCIGSNRLVTGLSVAQPEFQVAENVQVLNEFLFRGTPCECSRGEVRPLIARSELAGAVTTERRREQVTAHEVVVYSAKERYQRRHASPALGSLRIDGCAHVEIFRDILGESGSNHGLVSIIAMLIGEGSHDIQRVVLIELLVIGNHRLEGQVPGPVVGLRSITVRGVLAFDRLPVIVNITLVCII